MNKGEIINKWVAKAGSDIRSAEILLNNAENPPTDAICFHAQQAVEKLLKAYLTSVDIKAGKTHDILSLLELCIEKDKEFETLPIEKLGKLTFYAVELRYPDEFYIPTYEEAEESLNLAKMVEKFVIEKLQKQKKDC